MVKYLRISKKRGDSVPKKMGRPTDSPKIYQLRVRFSEEGKELLEKCSEKTGLSKSDVIRLGIKKVYESLEN